VHLRGAQSVPGAGAALSDPAKIGRALKKGKEKKGPCFVLFLISAAAILG
jgi:hypothetical protein